MNLRDLIEQSWQTSEDHGFHADQHDGVEYDIKKILLMVEELIEVHGEFRDGRDPTEVYWKCKVCGSETREMPFRSAPHVFSNPSLNYGTDIRCTGEFKPEGVPVEMADLLIRAADYVRIRGIDVESAIKIKAEYNKGREYMHGRKH